MSSADSDKATQDLESTANMETDKAGPALGETVKSAMGEAEGAATETSKTESHKNEDYEIHNKKNEDISMAENTSDHEELVTSGKEIPLLQRSSPESTIAERRRSSSGSPAITGLHRLNLKESSSESESTSSDAKVKFPGEVLRKDPDTDESSSSEVESSSSDSESESEESQAESSSFASKDLSAAARAPQPFDDDYVPPPPSSKDDLSKDSYAANRQKLHQNLTAQDIYEYEIFRTKMIYPATAFDNNGHIEDEIPYTAVNEEAKDAEKAATLDIEVSQVCSDQDAKRMFRTIERGNLPKLSDLTEKDYANTKSYLVCTDLSPEASHAMEWTIGTIIRDGAILFAVCAFEDDPSNPDPAQEGERLDACQRITEQIVKLLKKTRLQIHVVVEVLHSRSPGHLITEVIDYISPTLVIMGSRGRSGLKGVLLGSFSNYILQRSSVPVMVARRKLHKLKNKDINVRLANNLRPPIDFGDINSSSLY